MLEGDPGRPAPHRNAADDGPGVGRHREEGVGARSGGDKQRAVVAQSDTKGSGEGLAVSGLLRRQRLKIEKRGRRVAAWTDGCDPIEKGAVFEFGEAVALGAGATVDVVAGIGLGDEHAARVIHG